VQPDFGLSTVGVCVRDHLQCQECSSSFGYSIWTLEYLQFCWKLASGYKHCRCYLFPAHKFLSYRCFCFGVYSCILHLSTLFFSPACKPWPKSLEGRMSPGEHEGLFGNFGLEQTNSLKAGKVGLNKTIEVLMLLVSRRRTVRPTATYPPLINRIDGRNLTYTWQEYDTHYDISEEMTQTFYSRADNHLI